MQRKIARPVLLLEMFQGKALRVHVVVARREKNWAGKSETSRPLTVIRMPIAAGPIDPIPEDDDKGRMRHVDIPRQVLECPGAARIADYHEGVRPPVAGIFKDGANLYEVPEIRRKFGHPRMMGRQAREDLRSQDEREQGQRPNKYVSLVHDAHDLISYDSSTHFLPDPNHGESFLVTAFEFDQVYDVPGQIGDVQAIFRRIAIQCIRHDQIFFSRNKTKRFWKSVCAAICLRERFFPDDPRIL